MKRLKKNILVVQGGISKERNISLETGKACIKSMKRLGYKVSILDPAKKFLNGILENSLYSFWCDLIYECYG